MVVVWVRAQIVLDIATNWKYSIADISEQRRDTKAPPKLIQKLLMYMASKVFIHVKRDILLNRIYVVKPTSNLTLGKRPSLNVELLMKQIIYVCDTFY